ncbi:MAG: hypothetical protein FJZ01_15650 [Candidatus Sericytochromatia bacterium]|nr:hypothetical protein [Candidatus Tanganyikabacteria bacterium]
MTFYLSQNQKVRLMASLAILFAAAGLLVFVQPAWEDWQTRETELHGLVAQLPPERSRPESLGQLIRRITRTRGALEEQRARFPISENIAQLLVELQGILEGSEITKFYPTKLEAVNLAALASTDTRVLQQRIMVDSAGSFFELRNFLERLESFKHPVQVRSLEIREPDDQEAPGRLEMRFTMAAFLLDRAQGGAEAEQRALDELLATLHEDALDPPESAPPPVEIAAPPPLPPRELVPDLPRTVPPAPRPVATMRPVPAPRPPTPRLEIPPSTRMEPANWRVLGIMFYSKDIPTAILHLGDSQIAVTREDPIEDGWVVDRIDPRRVVVRRGDLKRVLELQDGSGEPPR